MLLRRGRRAIPWTREAPLSTTHFVLRYAHIVAGLLTLACGILAMTFAKGSRPHRIAGNVFFVSMLVLASSGVVLAFDGKPNMGNIMGGVTALYMVVTAWATVIRPPGTVGTFERVAALAGLGIGGAATSFAVLAMNAPNGRFNGYPPLMYLIFAGVVLAATALDGRMILRGGVTGAARTSRHLSRMSLAFFMATGSFFFGQPKFVPTFLKETGLYIVAGLFPLALLLYWMARVRVWPALRRPRPSVGAP